MKKTVLIIIIAIGLLETLLAQEINLPEKISISDKFFSPWGTSLLYEYDLELRGNYYMIQRTIFEENGRKKNRDKQIGKLDIHHIKQLLLTIEQNPSREIRAIDFINSFSSESINDFFKKEADNYWINNDFQKQFIIEQLTEPEKLKDNLELYFQDYDHSGYIDGPSTEVQIAFHFGDSITTVSSKSILWVGLPIEINGRKTFSPKLAGFIGELIPESKTNRKEQFSVKELSSAIIKEVIGSHRRTIDNLESKSYQVYIDSLKTNFIVSNERVVNGTPSTNWDGEKRFSCKLREISMRENVSISYSTTIENGAFAFPVSRIISDYERLYSTVIGSTFFGKYLSENKERNLSIIYDDNSCFTKKSREFATNDCKLSNLEIEFENSVFISLQDEFGGISRWGLLPNGQYFMWWNNGSPPIPEYDKNYLKCE